MDDLAPDETPHWRLLHFPLLTLLGACGFFLASASEPRYPASRALLDAMLKALPAVAPVYLATRGMALRRIFVWSLLVQATAVLAWTTLAAPSGLLASSVDTTVSTVALWAGLAVAGFVFMLPLVWLARRAATLPRERNVANEALVLGGYGLLSGVVPWRLVPAIPYCGVVPGSERAPACAVQSLATVTLGLAVVATFVTAVVGIAWEVRMRRRVRAVLAGAVPGWSAWPSHAVAGAERVPALRWLDWVDWMNNRPPRAGAFRVLVRTSDDLAGSAYREHAAAGTPWVRVPARVSPLGERVFANALIAACAARVFPALWSALTR